MNDSRFRWILYIIVIVILSTITIQIYWNYKNYQNSKQQFINDVQVSLDNAVETYYANLAEKSTLDFAIEANSEGHFFNLNNRIDSIISKFDTTNNRFKQTKKINFEQKNDVIIYQNFIGDSLLKDVHFKDHSAPSDSINKSIKWLKGRATDSLLQDNFKMLTSKVIISMTADSLSLKGIDSLLKEELKRKQLTINYGLSFKDLLSNTTEQINPNIVNSAFLSTASKSDYFPNESVLKVYFHNETRIILKRIITGILISTLLVVTVISCLFYLLKIIRHQKRLAEVKNDLISNITHEFKTPIATISVAIESIKSFNVMEDKAKTKKYLELSNNQLSKLNLMVEKLLETATLDSENLNLVKEQINISNLLEVLVEKHQLQTQTKIIHFKNTNKNLISSIDGFHIENALNNVIDNAIKYGGEVINVELKKEKNNIIISISDNGNTLTKANKANVFEKFYRVPKGNTHNIKGFGIGLYYTKKIIEKHRGNIELNLGNKLTTFKITLPDAE